MCDTHFIVSSWVSSGRIRELCSWSRRGVQQLPDFTSDTVDLSEPATHRGVDSSCEMALHPQVPGAAETEALTKGQASSIRGVSDICTLRWKCPQFVQGDTALGNSPGVLLHLEKAQAGGAPAKGEGEADSPRSRELDAGSIPGPQGHDPGTRT